MPMLGQASGGWTESSSALRLLHVGIRNTVGVLTDDSFTQTNPPALALAGSVSAQVDQTQLGVLSGSVAFTRPDSGSNFIGGTGAAALLTALNGNVEWAVGFKPLGCFINSANGNAFENTPGTASGKGPYVSSQGTYGNALYESQCLDGTGVAGFATGDPIPYATGVWLVASANGYLMPREVLDAGAGAMRDLDVPGAGVTFLTAESWVLPGGAGSATNLAVCKMPPDAVQNEVVYDQRV